MAEYLKRQHHLLALKTSSGREGRAWNVHFELELHTASSPDILMDRRISTDQLGLPRYFEAESTPSFQIPAEITDELRQQIDNLNIEPSHPLWLHLVKPYGYLAMVPWEDLLVPALSRPVLRLPDFLEPPRERRDTLDVAICCSVPLDEHAFSVPQVLGDIAGAILGGSPRPRTQIHIFPDLGSYEPLRSQFAAESRVSVHDPSGAAAKAAIDPSAAVSDGGRTVNSPWLRWMRDSMQGRSLDTVHFVCHGYFSGDRVSLTVTESPDANPYGRRPSRFLGVAETSAFLNQTGAWSLVCTAPPLNYSDAGLRYFVDSLAQARPGPALFHDLNRDPGLTALRRAYEFLFSPTPREAVAGPIFMYCQPALVDTQLPIVSDGGYASTIASLNSDLFSAAAPPTSVVEEAIPNWLASTQRYVEEQTQQAQRRDASAARTPTDRARRSASVVAETLADVQRITLDYAQRAKRGKSGGDIR